MSTETAEDVTPAPPGPLRLLAVGGDSSALTDLQDQIDGGAVVHAVGTDAAALQQLSERAWDGLLLLLQREPEEQLAWWAEVLARLPRRPGVITLTPTPTMSVTLRAAHLGALDVLPLPADRASLRAALARLRPNGEVVVPLRDGSATSTLVAESPAMLEVFRTVARVAPSTASVLIVGESGTGKELIARAIHDASPRASGPFVAVNCAAIPRALLESELFGHERGAFTGAEARNAGRFERAHGGTLFLDEVGDMDLALQAKILRALQEHEIERVGAHEATSVDVRCVAATHRDLAALMRQGRFREDLYYRIAVVSVALPRLAERGDDLLLLTSHFLREFGASRGLHFTGITERALALLRQHEWVGNVRELRNVVERAALVADGPVVREADLPGEWQQAAAGTARAEPGVTSSLAELEAYAIVRALAAVGGRIAEAARILGIHRNTLTRKIREYELAS